MENSIIDVNDVTCRMYKDISATEIKFLSCINPFFIVSGKASNTGICYRNNGKNAIYGMVHYNQVNDEVTVVDKKNGKESLKKIKYSEYIKNCHKLYQSDDFIGFVIDESVYSVFVNIISHIDSYTQILKNDLKVITYTKGKKEYPNLTYFDIVFDNFEGATHKCNYYISNTYDMENTVFIIKKGIKDDEGNVINFYSGYLNGVKDIVTLLKNYD